MTSWSVNCKTCQYDKMCVRKASLMCPTYNCFSYKPALQPHGEWRTTPNPNYSPFDSTSEVIYICSQCAYSCGDRITKIWNFCPNCGADMRGKNDE